MRTIKYLFWTLIAIILLTIGFANRDSVTITLLPDEFVHFAKFNASATLPLYVVILGGIAAGLLIGFVWEWLREHKHRAEAVSHRRDKAVLENEVKKLKADRNEGKDDVLALLEDAEASR